MTERLRNGNIEVALQYIHPNKRAVYRQMFDILQARLPQIASTEIDFKVVEVAEKYARCELITNEDGRTYSYEVLFVRDDDGNWYLYSF